MLIRTETFRKAQPAAGGITVGTVGSLTYNDANQSSYTFVGGPTIDGGGAALLAVPVWVTAFGDRTDDHTDALDSATLNGVAADNLLVRYLNNNGSGAVKYVQAGAALWTSPAAGDLVFSLKAGISATAGGCYFFNLTGLAASPLGALVRDQFDVSGTATALPFQITTTVANSLVISINGARNGGNGPFTFDNGAFDGNSLGEEDGASATNGNWDVAYRNGLSIATYDAGGDWTSADADQIGGGAFELKPA